MISESPKTFKRQLSGWLSYAFASEVFVIVSLTLFLPICLEQFARDNGRISPDRIEPCLAAAGGEAPTGRCEVSIGGLFWIDTASFSLYTNSASVALQALTVISAGGIADHPPHRKKLLLGFALVGALAATLFLLLSSSSPVWFIAAILAILANVGFGVSTVAMNSYLPSLAKASPEVVQLAEEIKHAATLPSVAAEAADDIDEPLLQHEDEQIAALMIRYDTELSRATSRISSMGIALGYGSGIFLLLLALIPVTKLHGTTFSLRLAIGLSGIWWTIFSLPAAAWLPSGASTEGRKEWKASREIIAAWKRLGGMLHPREVKKLKNTFKYLAAWFLLSDGFTTITSTAVLFGKTSLHMSASALILVGVLTPSTGILGSLLWPLIQKRFGWSNLKVLIILVLLVSIVPAYGCLGFLNIFRNTGFGGLTTPGELYFLAVFFGSVYGAFQGYARAFYAELLPPGEEARWYGLFSITDKSSSFVGPLCVGLISDTTGNIRYAFFFLVIMIWLAVPILSSVNVDKGKTDARGYVYSRERDDDEV